MSAERGIGRSGAETKVRSSNGNYLQNQDPITQCENKNKADWESMTLERIDENNDKYVLTSNRTGCRLQCKHDGTALFANKNRV